MNGDKPYMQPYHRPNQTWACGCDGDECLCGTARNSKNGCRRQWSLRTRRRVFVVACFAIAFSYALVGLWQPLRRNFASPGPLHSVHARLVSGESNADPHSDPLMASQSCVHCHNADGKTPLQWLASVFDCGRSPVDSASQSEKCLKCHEAQLGSTWAMFAHNVDPAQLAKQTHPPASAAAKQSSSWGGMFALVSTSSSGSAIPPSESAKKLTCATCHHEHKGAHVDIKAMTDRQCQSCHKNECRSFATDHPQFTKWPSYSERPHIAFTHVAHETKHFAAKNQTFDCNRCHVDDANGNTKLLAGFQQACASCHEGEIKVAAAEGMPVVALPTFDFDAFRREKATAPESWPDAARGDFDGKLPDIMVLLLAADKKATDALARFAPHFDLARIDANQPDDVKNAAVLATAITELVLELRDDARTAVRQRMESLRNRPLLETELDRLMSRLPQELLSQTVDRWFSPQDKKTAVTDASIPSPWHFVLQTKPAAQSMWLRANPLKGMVRKPADEANGAPSAKEGGPGGTKANAKNAANPRSNGPSGMSPRAIAVPANTSGEILRPNPLAKPDTHSQPAAQLPETPSDPEPAVVEPEPASLTDVAESKSAEKSFPNQSGESAHHSIRYAANGGWFADDETFAIKYRPEGHADPVMVAWLEIAADLVNRQDVWATSVKNLVRGTAAQSCIRCHAGADPETGSQSMRWHAEIREISTRPFTKFSHRPHVLSNDQEACRTCHDLNRDLLSVASQENLGDRSLLTGAALLAPPARCDFKPLEKATCAQCHNATGASQSCTQCHNYHVGAKVGGSW
jgi:hypothetical protein